ncbi:MAG: hypothetical protein KAT71_03475 [Gammaproteobacteria bacterium]|nr:hypothetical protein [Gammaproteobacteria bacterium]
MKANIQIIKEGYKVTVTDANSDRKIDFITFSKGVSRAEDFIEIKFNDVVPGDAGKELLWRKAGCVRGYQRYVQDTGVLFEFSIAPQEARGVLMLTGYLDNTLEALENQQFIDRDVLQIIQDSSDIKSLLEENKQYFGRDEQESGEEIVARPFLR